MLTGYLRPEAKFPAFPLLLAAIHQVSCVCVCVCMCVFACVRVCVFVPNSHSEVN